MAMTLQGFRDSMLHNEMLSAQVLQAQASQLLSEQLLELTGAVPVAIFQLHLTREGHSDLRFVTPRWETVVRHALTPTRSQRCGSSSCAACTRWNRSRTTRW
jgi:hypothetical protein